MTARPEPRDEAGRFGPIFDPRRSVVLVASAGTGKTWRLVRRYLRIIAGRDPSSGEPWARPEQVVAVTFTRAAAAEMRARVFAALTTPAAAVDASDAVLAELVASHELDARLALAERLAAAPIGTLHSLCARLLAEFPELSGVPPEARPLDPGEQLLELETFVRGWLDRALDDPRHRAHPGCLELLRAHPLAFVRRELQAMVAERRPLGTQAPGTEAGEPPEAAEAIAATREQFVRAQWRDYIAQMQGPLTLLWHGCVQQTQRGHAPPRVAALGALLTRIIQRHLPEPELSTVDEDLRELLATRPSAKLGSLEQPLQQLRNIHRVVSTRRERPILPDPHAADDRPQAAHLARWLTVATLARRDWAETLRRRATLRYDDLETLACELLDDPRAAEHLRGRVRHLLVDEYQDIDATQAQILERLAELGGDRAATKVFFVGDPKQSIYRFRGADPQVFERAVVTRPEAVVELVEDRRSSPALARFLGQLFPPLFAGALPWANTTAAGRPPELALLGDIADHATVPWTRDIEVVRDSDRLPGLAVDLLLRDRGRPAAHPELHDEAARVALHLRGLIDRAELRASELAILVPRWSLAEDHRAALEAQGIAADLAGGRGLLALPEVRDLINLVRLWADARDGLAAAAVLRGPCFAISDLGLYVLARWPGVDRRVREADPDLPEFAALDELWEPWDDATRREGEPEDDLLAPGPRAHPRPFGELLRHGRLDAARAHAALRAAEVIREPDLRARLADDAAALEEGRDRLLARSRQAGARSTADLLADVIAEFRLEAHWLAGPRGHRAVANAWRFVEHLRGLERDGPDLARLCAWLDAGAEPAPEGLISPGAEAVTITTWHGAKGKEWPVVVVAGLGETARPGARQSWSREGVPSLDPARGDRIEVPRIHQPHDGFSPRPDPLHEPCTHALEPLEAAEAKRLLYVALTRARDRLVLSGVADARTHVHYDDKPWLGLPWGFDLQPLLGEPKPLFLCRRPLELLVAALDLPAAPAGSSLLRPRTGAWSGAHLQVVDDAMLLAAFPGPQPGAAAPLLELELGARPGLPVASPANEAPALDANADSTAAATKQDPPANPSAPRQLGFAAFGFDDGRDDELDDQRDPTPPAPPDPLAWRAGPALQIWRPSSGRMPWPVAELEWDLPLPARRPVLLEDEDPRLLGELVHGAMERWNLEGPVPDAATLLAWITPATALRPPDDRRRLATWLHRCLALVAEGELADELGAAAARGELFHEVDVDSLVPAADRDHRIRGRIDLLWCDASGAWNLIDYKVTAKLRSRAQMQELQWSYGAQLLGYRRALEHWRPGGRAARLGRFGLWLVPAGKAMWLRG